MQSLSVSVLPTAINVLCRVNLLNWNWCDVSYDVYTFETGCSDVKKANIYKNFLFAF